MRAPIVIHELDSGDVSIYREPRDAALSMEAIDVVDGNYRAFDSDGYPLHIETQFKGKVRSFFRWKIVPNGTVELRDIEGAVALVAELRVLLARVLHVSACDLEEMSLTELVKRAMERLEPK